MIGQMSIMMPLGGAERVQRSGGRREHIPVGGCLGYCQECPACR